MSVPTASYGNYRHGARTKATIELWRFIKSLS
jgi:hypothetical protein